MGSSSSTTAAIKVIQIKPSQNKEPFSGLERIASFENSKQKTNNGTVVTDHHTLEGVKDNGQEQLPDEEKSTCGLGSSKDNQFQNLELNDENKENQEMALASVTPLHDKSANSNIILSSITPSLAKSIHPSSITNAVNMNSKTKAIQGNDINEERFTQSANAITLLSVTPTQTENVHLDVNLIRSHIKEDSTTSCSHKGEVNRTEDISLDIPASARKRSTLPKVNALVEQFWPATAPDDDLPSWVHGLATIADGYTLVLDLNNNKLKLFDENYAFCCDILVSEECRGITSVYSNEVAMTSGTNVLFYFVDKEGFVLQQRCFKLNGEGFGISYGRRNFAISCDLNNRSKACIRILSDKGKQRYVIKTCYGVSLKSSRFVRLDPNKDIVYISDIRNRRVVSMTYEGQELWQVRLEDEPGEVLCMDSYLLIADHRQHQLLQVSCDGQENEPLLTEEDDLWNPHFLTFNSKTNHLLISTPENIMVFKLV